MKNQRSFLFIFILFSGFGIMHLLTMSSRPSWASIRTVDVVRLIGTGMCFGVAIFCLAAYFFGRRFLEVK
jgi:hypothetical protein